MTKVKTDAPTLGMWVFLASEILFFGGLFLSFAVYRYLYPEAFSAGSKSLSLTLGAVNTFILLTSSYFMAKSVDENKTSRLPITFAFAFLFLIVKGFEYREHYVEGAFPLLNWKGAGPHLLLFYVLYFIMTLIHALHILIGMGLMIYAYFARANDAFLRNLGLYWHFVDVVWVFIFPILYLVGRT